MANQLPLRCSCGSVHGAVHDVSPELGNRMVCMCDDCQAFAHFLGRAAEVLDAHGGTDLFQVPPGRVEISSGREHVRCMRLSERGLVRWYAECCNAPIGNTLAAGSISFVGLVLTFVDPQVTVAARDQLIGAPIEYTFGKFARGGMPANAQEKASLGVMLRMIRLLARSWRDRHTPNPFFDEQRKPRIAPKILSKAERDALWTQLQSA